MLRLQPAFSLPGQFRPADPADGSKPGACRKPGGLIARMAAAIPAGGWPPVPPILKTRRPPMLISVTAVFLFTAMLASGQTNGVTSTNHPAELPEGPAGKALSQAGQSRAAPQQLEALRADCIQARRMVCGKILQVLPE